MERSRATDPDLLAAQERLEAWRRSQGRSEAEPAPEPGRRLEALPGGAEKPERDDRGEPLIDPGLYEVAYVRAHPRKMWGRRIWRVELEVLEEGPAKGIRLPLFLNVPDPSRRPTRRCRMVTTFALATGRRPPKDLHRLKPATFMQGCTFQAEVVTITRDADGVQLPEVLHRSRAKCVHRLLAGTPPYARRSRA